MIKMQILVGMWAVLVTACSREQTGSVSRSAETKDDPLTEGRRNVVATHGTVAGEGRSAESSAHAAAADIHTVSGLFCSVTERLELQALRDEALREEERREAERQRQDADEERRLQALFEQYSNRWEHIPDEHDRFMVARMIPDLARVEQILLRLMASSDRAVVADVARYLRFFYERRQNRLEDGLAILREGERRLLAGRNWHVALSDMRPDERHAVAQMYVSLAVSEHMRNNHEATAYAFRRAAESSSDDPERCASRYIDLACACENMRQSENAIRAYEQAEEQFQRIKDPRKKAVWLAVWDSIQERKQNIGKGRFETTHWAH